MTIPMIPQNQRTVAAQFKTQSDNLIDLTRDTFRDKSDALWRRFESERRANQNNLEHGFPLEDFFRREFGEMLHEPYAVGNGKIVDHQQYTCGDCDFIIYDKRLAPLLRPPATPESRRKFFAFETTYGIIEVKSTLTLGATDGHVLRANPKGTLWDACKKIFAYKELDRRPPQGVTWGVNHPIGIAFFYNCDLDISVQENRDAILAEFATINMSVAPEMRVNAAYVLNKLSLSWVFVGEVSPNGPIFVNLQHPVESPHPIWASYSPTAEDTLYHMYTMIWSTLARTQLYSPDLLNEYGAETHLRGKNHRGIPCSLEANVELFASTSGQSAETLLANMRGDYDKIEQILSEIVNKSPDDVAAQVQLAEFLSHKRRKTDAAMGLLKQAIAADPDNVQAASAYAHVMAGAGKPVALGEEILRNLVVKKGDDPTAQFALAMFLLKWKGHGGEGLDILRGLADRHTNDYSLLDTYATQLRNLEEHRPEAKQIYEKIISTAPGQTNTLGNYAQLLFWEGRIEEGRVLVERALAEIGASGEALPGLGVELYFYQYAHVAEARNDALIKLKRRLLLGAASPGWNLEPNVEYAIKEGHPQPRLLCLIADVIVGRVDLQVLQQDSDWKNING